MDYEVKFWAVEILSMLKEEIEKESQPTVGRGFSEIAIKTIAEAIERVIERLEG